MRFPPSVQAWFKANGKKGGTARAKNLSKERLIEIARIGAQARAAKRKASVPPPEPAA